MKRPTLSNRFEQLRKQAERILEKSAGGANGVSELDVLGLIHELEVHQIELQNHNEELRRVIQELEKSRNQFADLYDGAPVGYFTLHRDGIITQVNLTGAEMLGRPKRYLINRRFFRFVYPEDQKNYFSQVKRVIDTGIRSSCELRLIRANGSPFYAQLEIVPGKDEEDEFNQCCMAVVDITTQKQGEQKLREQSDLLNVIHDSVIVRTADDRVVFWNRGAEETYGWKKEEALGKVAHSLLQTRFAGSWGEIKAELLRNGWWEGELQQTTRDGRKIIVSSRCIMHKDEPGKYLRFVEINKDITDRKQAENALRESEELFRQIAENTREIFWMSNPERTVVHYISPHFEKVFGIPVQSIYEAPQRMIDMIHPEDRDGVVSALPKQLRGLYDEEYRIVRPDGQIRWVWDRAFPVHDPEGKVYRIVGIAEEITERKYMEEKLFKMNMELERRVQERTVELARTNRALQAEISERRQTEEALRESQEGLRRLSSQLINAQEDERKRISLELHDSIGSLLSAVKFGLESTLSQAEQGIADWESLRALTSVVQEAIEETRRMMTDLRPPMLDDLGLLTSIGWFCKHVRALCSTMHIDEEIAIEEEEIPERLRIVIFRIIQEALHNTLKYSKANLVKLSLMKKPETIELMIQDNGQGFDVDEVFSKVDYRQGLGLTSMKERTELSGGTFTIESARGQGSRILARWPCSRP